MMKSMTGFASVVREDGPFQVAVTARSVNHRFLDLQLRLPSTLASLEPGIRALVPRRLSRGRVELTLNVQNSAPPSLDVSVDTVLVRRIESALADVRAEGLVSGTLAMSDLLRIPQVLTIRERTADPDGVDGTLARLADAAVDEALVALDVMRRREGELLRSDLDTRRSTLAVAIDEVERGASAGQQALRERIGQRVAELGLDGAEPAAIAQEIVRFVSRSDIHEEVVRFRAHLTHWAALVDDDEPCGRKLDFLLQEMNREVNTIGSKVEGPHVPALVVELKAELERMREQVQNVE